MTVQVVDLFCGVGGLTRGLRDEGFNVVAGYDNDPTCEYAYSFNNNASFHLADITNVTGDEIAANYDKDSIRILVGCAPCQPFSLMRSKMGDRYNELDKKYTLLNEFGRIIEEVQPTIVSMENVPQLYGKDVLDSFLEILEKHHYRVKYQVVYCPDYGICQGRRRFVLLASKLGDIELIKPTHDKNEVKIESFIKDLPKIKAGEICKSDPLHQAANLSELNIKRIKCSKPGGSWKDWPKELRCACHKKESGQSYTSVYGRMSWGKIGPTITTQFYNYGTGRHGHPDQDRALSLREGALLQTFPINYQFYDPNLPYVFNDVARHIGNAVPVRLGQVIGQSIKNHLQEHGYELD